MGNKHTKKSNTNVLGSPKTMSYVLFNTINGPLLEILGFINMEDIQSFMLVNKTCLLILEIKFKFKFNHKNIKFKFDYQLGPRVIQFCIYQSITIPEELIEKYLDHHIKNGSGIDKFKSVLTKESYNEGFIHIITYMFMNIDEPNEDVVRFIFKKRETTTEEYGVEFSRYFNCEYIKSCVRSKSKTLLKYLIRIFNEDYLGLTENLHKISKYVDRSNCKMVMSIVNNLVFKHESERKHLLFTCFRFMNHHEVKNYLESYDDIAVYDFNFLIKMAKPEYTPRIYLEKIKMYIEHATTYDTVSELDYYKCGLMIVCYVIREYGNNREFISKILKCIGIIDIDHLCWHKIDLVETIASANDSFHLLDEFLKLLSIEIFKMIFTSKNIECSQFYTNLIIFKLLRFRYNNKVSVDILEKTQYFGHEILFKFMNMKEIKKVLHLKTNQEMSNTLRRFYESKTYPE